MKKVELRNYFEVHTNDCSNPTFITDYHSGELIYLNQAMEKKFQIFQDYIGEKAEDIIPYFHDMCGYDQKESVVSGKFQEKIILSEMLNSNLRAQVTLLDVSGEKYLQTKYFLAPTSDKRQEAEIVFEKAIARCLEILSDSKLLSPIVPFLELLGEFYACELSYIVEFSDDKSWVTHHHIWSADGSVKTIPSGDAIAIGSFVQWLEGDHFKSVINLERSEHNYEAGSIETMILDQYQLNNITLSKLWNQDGTLMGLVGLSNRIDLMYDDRLLQAVSHFVMEQFSKKSMVEALEEMNEIDLLTGFFNRNKYAERLIELERNPPENLGVLFVNLNGLRTTNEYLGYEAGDEQLRKTSCLLSEYFNNGFYRVTGDEFVGFVENCDQEIFQETVDALQERLGKQHNEAHFSFGHSWECGHYSLSNLIKIADTVMVINKQAFYHETLKDMEKITNTMLQDLFRGLDEDEFLVYLQPQVDLKTEEVVGAEALVRRQKEDKMVFPDQFIPLYEENNMIRHVDLFVVEKVCQLIAQWKEMGKTVAVSVNLSRVTLLEHGIVRKISTILDEYHVAHELVIIEITERIGMIENNVASSLVDEFKNNGFKLSLDDFGCAYSNIVSLATISVDEVKIDKSLVDNVLTNPKNGVIVKSMLSMCSALEGTHTLAEGIETREQADFLRNADCQLGQGYFYARPMPCEQFTQEYIAK